MSTKPRKTLAEIENRVCDITSSHLAIPRHEVLPSHSFVEDLGCDSLDLVELIMAIEEDFAMALPDDSPDPVYKSIFTRQPFRLSDLAELVYVFQGLLVASTPRTFWRKPSSNFIPLEIVPFTQLDGQWRGSSKSQSLFEPLKQEGPLPQFRRRSDGMRCIQLPAASVEIGSDEIDGLVDERPKHTVELSSFLIDAEPVSTTAYCRFLNSIAPISTEMLEEWIVLDPSEHRFEHQLVKPTSAGWRCVAGTERWPMILVSWYGANAYSLWANGKDWRTYRDDAKTLNGSSLPSEAQWEYAARGSDYQRYPWGDRTPSGNLMCYGQHRRGTIYQAETLPMADVNEPLGLSPFGLHHMAGNVWQWCRDWYDAAFYGQPESRVANPVNQISTRVRSERGGSWIGPPELCRSSYRRGRLATARGRCLGFRCVSSISDLR